MIGQRLVVEGLTFFRSSLRSLRYIFFKKGTSRFEDGFQVQKAMNIWERMFFWMNNWPQRRFVGDIDAWNKRKMVVMT